MTVQPFIDETFHAEQVRPELMDLLWAQGWRHFGVNFFRYNLMESQGDIQSIAPLRIRLDAFDLTKSQRRVLRKNADVVTEVLPATLHPEVCAMFERHKQRFADNVPTSLETFLGSTPESGPCQCLELRCRINGELAAVSFFDVGLESISSVYALFEPTYSARSLGIFTMLFEVLWAMTHGKRFAYPGYATHGSSRYDYKKQFRSLETYDWATRTWSAWSEVASNS
ncbi:MAG: arginine-tRNA-protein transferase [Roseimicrobium sp.]